MCSFLPVIKIRWPITKEGKSVCCIVAELFCMSAPDRFTNHWMTEVCKVFYKSVFDLRPGQSEFVDLCMLLSFLMDTFTQKLTFSNYSIPCQWKVRWNLVAHKTFLEFHGSSGVIQSLQKPQDPKSIWCDIIIYPLMHPPQTKCALTLLALAATVKIPALR